MRPSSIAISARTTNSMLSTNLMRNLHANYRRSDKLQNMMSTGRKYAHMSDNPMAMIYAQTARNKMARLSHFQSSVDTAKSWMVQVEAGVKELQDVMVNAYEALIDATTDGKTPSDKNAIAQTVKQLRDHFVDTLNASFGNEYVFGGYNTPGDPGTRDDQRVKPFALRELPPDPVTGEVRLELLYNGFNLSQFDGMPSSLLTVNLSRFSFFNDPPPGPVPPPPPPPPALRPELGSPAHQELQRIIAGPPNLAPVLANLGITEQALLDLHFLRQDVLTFDIGPGVEMPVTFSGIDLVLFSTRVDGNEIVRNNFNVLDDLYRAISNAAEHGTHSHYAQDLTGMIGPLQDGANHLLSRIAEIGGKNRRLDLFTARYEQDQINNRQILSDAQDVDMAEVIMELRMAEAVMQASMAAGARIIQPTLMDFLR